MHDHPAIMHQFRSRRAGRSSKSAAPCAGDQRRCALPGRTITAWNHVDHFCRYDELTAYLHRVAGDHPDLVGLTSIGQSHEGREIWLVTVTDRATGDHADKPAMGSTRTSTRRSSLPVSLPSTSSTVW
ncbi:MAG: M14 family zinc carboxypeptidase [Acidimicrobiales bacterium]